AWTSMTAEDARDHRALALDLTVREVAHACRVIDVDVEQGAESHGPHEHGDRRGRVGREVEAAAEAHRHTGDDAPDDGPRLVDRTARGVELAQRVDAEPREGEAAEGRDREPEAHALAPVPRAVREPVLGAADAVERHQ